MQSCANSTKKFLEKWVWKVAKHLGHQGPDPPLPSAHIPPPSPLVPPTIPKPMGPPTTPLTYFVSGPSKQTTSPATSVTATKPTIVQTKPNLESLPDPNGQSEFFLCVVEAKLGCSP